MVAVGWGEGWAVGSSGASVGGMGVGSGRDFGCGGGSGEGGALQAPPVRVSSQKDTEQRGVSLIDLLQ